MRVLLVEDDTRLSQALAGILRENKYEVDVVADGQTGLQWASVDTGTYDAIILDVMLPKMDGFAVVSSLRRSHINTPVLMLTARDSVRDKISGLDAGADDYMTKPFAPSELMARLRALTRRQSEVVFETVSAGDVQLDLDSHDLSVGEKHTHLTLKEFMLANLLIASAGKTVTKEQLIEKIWGTEAFIDDNNLEAYVSFLRKKLKFLGSQASIETMRGAGYRFVAANTSENAE